MLVTFCGLLLLPFSLKAEFSETFDRWAKDRSIYSQDGDWKKFNSGDQTQPRGNRALVRREGDQSHLSIFAHGHPTANARVYQSVHLPVSATSNRKFSVDIRPITPDTGSEYFNGVVFSIAATKNDRIDPAGRFSMGLAREQGEWVFIFTVGSGATGRIYSKPGEIRVDPSQWYRFEAELEPATGHLEVVVHSLDATTGPKRIWSATNEGLAPWRPETISQINLMVTRPGTAEERTHSADFANIFITP